MSSMKSPGILKGALGRSFVLPILISLIFLVLIMGMTYRMGKISGYIDGMQMTDRVRNELREENEYVRLALLDVVNHCISADTTEDARLNEECAILGLEFEHDRLKVYMPTREGVTVTAEFHYVHSDTDPDTITDLVMRSDPYAIDSNTP